MVVLNETLRTSTISPIKEYKQQLAELNRERPKMLISHIKNAAAAVEAPRQAITDEDMVNSDESSRTTTGAPCPCRPSDSNPLSKFGPWNKEQSADLKELSRQEDQLLQQLKNEITKVQMMKSNARKEITSNEEEVVEAEKELEEELDDDGDDDRDLMTTTEESTISPADQQRHLDLVAENLEVGVMFASKPIVQALTNPFVGTMTNRCV